MKDYPEITSTNFGEVTINDMTYEHDIYIFADGQIKKRKKSLAKEIYGTSHMIGPEELKKLCKEKPAVVFIGTGQSGAAQLTEDGRAYLSKHKIEYVDISTPEIIESYNCCTKSKAALIHVTC